MTVRCWTGGSRSQHEICYLFVINCIIWISKPVTKLHLLCFTLLQIEYLNFLAFPQLFTSLLLILKRLIASKQEHVINWYFLRSSVPRSMWHTATFKEHLPIS